MTILGAFEDAESFFTCRRLVRLGCLDLVCASRFSELRKALPQSWQVWLDPLTWTLTTWLRSDDGFGKTASHSVHCVALASGPPLLL